MSTTSKPAVTPEMVEKARLIGKRDELAEQHFDLGGEHRDLGTSYCPCDLAKEYQAAKAELEVFLESKRKRNEKRYSETDLASAVQDAVSEIATMLESWQIPKKFHKASFYTEGERGADEMLRHVAAALREKYGVKP